MDPICGMETDDDGQQECPHCGGQGEIMVCCDDLCQGQGYCIHGDGIDVCPACDGSGEYDPAIDYLMEQHHEGGY